MLDVVTDLDAHLCLHPADLDLPDRKLRAVVHSRGDHPVLQVNLAVDTPDFPLRALESGRVEQLTVAVLVHPERDPEPEFPGELPAAVGRRSWDRLGRR